MLPILSVIDYTIGGSTSYYGCISPEKTTLSADLRRDRVKLPCDIWPSFSYKIREDRALKPTSHVHSEINLTHLRSLFVYNLRIAMFSKLTVFLAVATASLALPSRLEARDGDVCSTGKLNCCDTIQVRLLDQNLRVSSTNTKIFVVVFGLFQFR